MRIKPAFVLGATLLAPTFANAATVNLQQLFDGDCLNGLGLSACDWALEYVLSTVPIDFSNIDLHVEARDFLGDGLGPISTFSYLFNDEFSVTEGDEIDIGFSYWLRSGKAVFADTLELTDVESEGAGGFITVTESKFADGVLVGELFTEADPNFGVEQLTDWTLLSQPSYYLFVEKEIVVQADVGGAISLGDMHQGHAPVPGPLALIAGGLLGAAALRRLRPQNAV